MFDHETFAKNRAKQYVNPISWLSYQEKLQNTFHCKVSQMLLCSALDEQVRVGATYITESI